MDDINIAVTHHLGLISASICELEDSRLPCLHLDFHWHMWDGKYLGIFQNVSETQIWYQDHCFAGEFFTVISIMASELSKVYEFKAFLREPVRFYWNLQILSYIWIYTDKMKIVWIAHLSCTASYPDLYIYWFWVGLELEAFIILRLFCCVANTESHFSQEGQLQWLNYPGHLFYEGQVSVLKDIPYSSQHFLNIQCRCYILFVTLLICVRCLYYLV